jgi:hypothetical protein
MNTSNEVSRPQRLFRYFSPSYSQIFTDRKLWFAAASDFNDIFEVYPRYDKLVPELLQKVLMREYAFLPLNVNMSYQDFRCHTKKLADRIAAECMEEYPEILQSKFGQYYGIVCFSEHMDSLLMWGHYTESHRGFVVEFDPEHTLFSPRDFGKVVYQTSRPILTMDADSQMLLRKSPEWAYEDEHRLVKPRSELTSGVYIRNGVECQGHYLPLPIDAIKAVYFGCKMSEAQREDLLKALQQYPHVKLFFMKRHHTEYKLDAIPWSEWKPTSRSAQDILNIPWPVALPRVADKRV